MTFGLVLEHNYLGWSTSLSGVVSLSNSVTGQVVVSQHMNPAWHPLMNLSVCSSQSWVHRLSVPLQFIKQNGFFFQSYVKKRGLKALFCVINLMLSFLQLLSDRYLLHSTMKVYCTGWVKEGLFNNTAVLLFATCQVCYFILCHMCVYHYVNITL